MSADAKPNGQKPLPSGDDFATMQAQLTAQQAQIALLLAGGPGAVKPAFTAPPKFPKGKAKWEVFVSHSPIPPGFKSLVVEADGPEAAWKEYLDRVDAALTFNRINSETRMQTNTDQTPAQRVAWIRDQVNAAKTFVALARKGKPEIIFTERGADVIESMRVVKVMTKDGETAINATLTGAAYVAARRDAMTVKGTVTREQIGFPELATAH